MHGRTLAATYSPERRGPPRVGKPEPGRPSYVTSGGAGAPALRSLHRGDLRGDLYGARMSSALSPRRTRGARTTSAPAPTEGAPLCHWCSKPVRRPAGRAGAQTYRTPEGAAVALCSRCAVGYAALVERAAASVAQYARPALEQAAQNIHLQEPPPPSPERPAAPSPGPTEQSFRSGISPRGESPGRSSPVGEVAQEPVEAALLPAPGKPGVAPHRSAGDFLAGIWRSGGGGGEAAGTQRSIFIRGSSDESGDEEEAGARARAERRAPAFASAAAGRAASPANPLAALYDRYEEGRPDLAKPEPEPEPEPEPGPSVLALSPLLGMVDRLPEAVRQGRRGGHVAGPTNKFTEHRADLSVADVNAALATLAFLTPADDLPTIMKALATSLGIAGKWKPKKFLEKAAAHLGEPVPRGKPKAGLLALAKKKAAAAVAAATTVSPDTPRRAAAAAAAAEESLAEVT